MAVKIRPVDKAFSDCVRERAGWCCERCGAYFEEGRRMDVLRRAGGGDGGDDGA